jgi:hypothetical protein
VKEKLLQAFANLANSVAAAVPKIVVGILLVIAAFAVAKLIEVVLRYTLTRVRLDKLIEKAGIDKALQRIGLRQELNVFLPRLVYFLVLFILAKTAADALGLIAISSAIGGFFSYLPNLVAALLLLILGASLARFVGDMVSESARNSGIDFAPSLGKLVSGLVIFVASMMAIAELRINTEIIHIVTSFILGGAALGFGISFGLGTRDIIRNITAGFYTRKFLQIGSQLEISGQRGTLTQINATHTVLQAEDREISVADAAFMDNIAQSSSMSS